MIPEKKQVILKSMLNLIEEHGLLGVPMSLLAKKAEVAAGTIYHYFESKDAIVLELFEYVKDQINHEIFKLKDNSKEEYEIRFQNIWVNLCRYFIDHPQTLNFMEQFFASPYHKMVHADETQFHEDGFGNFFSNGIREKAIKPYNPHIISTMFMGPLIIAVKKHNTGNHLLDHEQMKLIASIVWNSLKV